MIKKIHNFSKTLVNMLTRISRAITEITGVICLSEIPAKTLTQSLLIAADSRGLLNCNFQLLQKFFYHTVYYCMIFKN